MSVLNAIGGQQLAIGSGIAGRVSPTGTSVLHGNFQSYAVSPYQAFTGMFGVFIPNNDQAQLNSTAFVTPATFPAGTTFEWSAVKDPRYQSIEGYMTLGYGNYDDSIGGITPRQLKNITTLSLNVDWTYTGDPATGLLSECWPSATSHATGPITSVDPLAEVGFFPKLSVHSQAFAASLPAAGTGSFVDINGVTWNVGVGTNPQNTPYYPAWRTGYVDHHGPLPYKELFTFLIGQGKLTGNEWFNGLAFGAEVDSGVARLAINSFTPTYS